MEDKTYKTLNEELHSTFTDEYIYNAGMMIHQMAENFFDEQELEGKVYFADSIFEFVWLIF